MVGFIAGIVIGAILGFLMSALVMANKPDDDDYYAKKPDEKDKTNE